MSFNTHKKKLGYRALCMLMVVMMLVGLMPTTAFAGTIGSAGGTPTNPSVGTSSSDWAYNTQADSFTRYTLVRVVSDGDQDGDGDYDWSGEWDDGADSMDGNPYHVYYKAESGGINNYGANFVVMGSVDISASIGRNSAGVDNLIGDYSTVTPSRDATAVSAWFATNALGYTACGSQFVTANTMYDIDWANSGINTSNIGTYAASGELWGANHFLTDEEFAAWMTYRGYNAGSLSDSRMVDVVYSVKSGLYSNTENLFANMFYSATNSDNVYTLDGAPVTSYEATDAFKALLEYLVSPFMCQYEANESTYSSWGTDIIQLIKNADANGVDRSEAILRAFYDMPADTESGWTYDASTDNVQYKVIVETGMLMINKTFGTTYAMTLRDILALYEQSTKNSNFSGYGGLSTMWDAITILTNPLYPGTDHFYWIDSVTADEPTKTINVELETDSATIFTGPLTSAQKGYTFTTLLNTSSSGYIFSEGAPGYGVAVISGYDTIAQIDPTLENFAYLNIQKVGEDNTSTYLAATFTMYEDESCTTSCGTFTTNADGSPAKVNLGNETEKTVYFKETTAPSGYAVNDTVYKVTLNSKTHSEEKPATFSIANGTPNGEECSSTIIDPVGTNASDSYVLFDWNIPGTTDIRSSGTHDTMISTGSLTLETNGNTLGTGVPDFASYFTKCQSNISGIDVTVDESAGTVTWEFDDGTIIFTFEGWYTAATNGTSVTGSEKFPTYDTSHTEATASEPVVYYAQWATNVLLNSGSGSGSTTTTGNFYTIYFDYQDEGSGVTSTLIGDATVTIEVDGLSPSYDEDGNFEYWYENGKYFKLTFPIKATFAFPKNPVRDGYTFLGWSTSPTATTPTVTAAQVTAGNYSTPTKSTTYYAVWKADTETITWNANGGKFGSATTATTTQDYNTKLQAYSTEPTRTGYTFDGWYLDANCTIPYDAEYVVKSNITLYAGWKAEKVLVSYYDSREGTGFIETVEYEYGDSFTAATALVSTDGYTFNGWYSGSTAATSITKLTSNYLTYHNVDSTTGLTSEAGYWTLDLTAKWSEKTVDYTVTIIWDDLEDNDGCRPTAVQVGLISSNGNETVATKWVYDDGSDSQSCTFTDLPITISDESTVKVTYSVIFLAYKYTDADGTESTENVASPMSESGEIEVASASAYDDTVMLTYAYAVSSYSVSSSYAGSVTLTHDLADTGTDVTFTIIWDDDNNNDGKRPGSVLLVLYADGVKASEYQFHNSTTGIGYATGDSREDTWTYTFEGLQKYNDGDFIDYSFTVVNSDGTVFTNKDNADGTEDLYTTTYTSPITVAGSQKASTVGAILSYVNETVSPTATIEWHDESDIDGVRPDYVYVTLTGYQYNEIGDPVSVYVDSVKVNAPTGNRTKWSYTFADVPKYNDGTEITYVAEISGGLNSKVAGAELGYTTESNGLAIDNYHTPYTGDVSVQIEWDDNDNNDKIRPSSIDLQLYADGEVCGDVITLTETSDWGYTWNNLRKNSATGAIEYSVEVVEAVSGYSAAYLVDETTIDEHRTLIVNMEHTEDMQTLTITVEWDDESNRDGMRPDSVAVAVYGYQYNSETGSYDEVNRGTVTINANNATVSADGNTWTYTTTNTYPVKHDGEDILYYVKLASEVEEYTHSDNGLTTSISHKALTGSVTTALLWNDNNGNDNIRPEQVFVQLYANGKAYGSEIVLNSANEWSYTWKDLYSYAEGKQGAEVVYTVKIVDNIDGYTVTYTPESTTTINGQTLYINASHDTDVTDKTVTITWNDELNRDGQRPESVTITLYGYEYNSISGGYEYVVIDTQTITGDNDTDVWTYTFTNVPIYCNGEEILYSAEITSDLNAQIPDWANAYTSTGNGLEIVVDHMIDTGSISASILWADDNNKDGIRPDSIAVQLYADDVAIGSEVLLSADNNWRMTWDNLAIYTENEIGTETLYNVKVVTPDEYEAAYTPGYSAILEGNELIVTLSHNELVSDRTVTIHWNDYSNIDGMRPSEVTVTLYGYQYSAVSGMWEKVMVDTATFGDAVTKDTWTYTFNDLPIYNDGEKITYIAEITSDLNANLPVGSNGFTSVSNELDVVVSHDRNLGNITTSVQWVDDDDNDSTRPEQIMVQLYADSAVYGEPVVLNASNGWSYEWSELYENALNKEGVAIVYSVKVLSDLGDDYAIVYTPASTRTSDNQNILITISHDTELLDRTVTIYWNDESNVDGNRPETVTVTLYAYQYNAETGAWETVTKGFATINGDVTKDTWDYTFEDLPIFHDGEKIIYSAAITSDLNANLPEYANGFTQVTNEMTITVSHDRDLGNITTSVQWIDDNDNDKVRPEQIQVQLYVNGTAYGSTVILNKDNAWSYEWSGLNINEDGKEGARVEYSVKVLDDLSESYSIAYAPVKTAITDNQNLLITISHDKELTSKTAVITWDDDTNRDGQRPESVTLTLYGYQYNATTGTWETVEKTVQTISGDVDENEWTYTFTDLPIYNDGEEIVYTVDVTSDLNAQIPDWANEYTYAANEMDVTISHIIDTGSVETSIQWVDDDDNDSVRPESVAVQLYADDVAIGSEVLLTEENGWSMVWDNLPVFSEFEIGTETWYHVEVVVPDDYTAIYTPEYTTILEDKELVVTLIHGELTADRTVTIHWNDESNRDGVRPGTVTVTLIGYQYNKVTGDWESVMKTTTDVEGNVSEDIWTCVFKNLPIYADGEEIVYIAEISSDLNANLPYYSNGYTSVSNELDITVSHDTNLGSISTSIQWLDDEDNDSVRPEQVFVQLYADDAKVGAPVTLSADNNWSYQWDNLAVNAADEEGRAVVYHVEVVDDLSENYAIVYTPTTARTFDEQNLLITISHDTELLDRTVTIYWNDESNIDGNRPSAVTITLYGYQYNAENDIWETVTKGFATIDGDVTEDIWTYVFEQLPIYHDGKQIIYSASITSDLNALIPDGLNQYTDVTNEMDITVSKIRDTDNITTSIQWIDDEDNDSERPEQVFVQLYADDTAYGSAVVLNSSNGWSYEWTNLFVHAEGSEGAEIVYSVKVIDDLSSDYTIDYSPVSTTTSADQNLLITITHVTELTTKTATITWLDNNNRDGYRPDSVTVTLYGYQYNSELGTFETVVYGSYVFDSDEYDMTADTWSHTFEDLAIYHDGMEIIYSVDVASDLDINVPAGGTGYTSTAAEMDITIKHVADTGSVSTSIQWLDDNDVDNVRPDSVSVQLYADDVAVGSAVLLTAENDWSMTWDNLPIFVDGGSGTEIKYTVQVTAPDGYDDPVYTPGYTTVTEANEIIITLSHDQLLADRTVTIHWNDDSNRDGVRPENVDITLYAYRYNADLSTWETVHVETATVTDSVSVDTWSHTFADLPVYHDGEQIVYFAEVSSDLNANLPYYSNEYTAVTNEMDITISHYNNLGSISTYIQWVDDDDNDSERPEQVFVQLYADGKEYGEPVVLNAANGWSYTWDNLYINTESLEGDRVEYKVEIVDGLDRTVYADVYTPVETHITDEETLVITVSHNTELLNRTVTIHWNDESNVDGNRPSSVAVTLYAYQFNAEINVWETVTVGYVQLDGDVTVDTWTHVFEQLPIYHDGKQIIYSAAITSDMNANLPSYANGFTQVTNEMDITVSHDRDLGNISTSIQWVDDADNDNERPEQVRVQLYANEAAYGSVAILNAENNWSYEWIDLNVNTTGKEGTRVIYRVEVVDDLSDTYSIDYTPATTVTTDNQNLLITITHVTELLDRTVTINWEDASNQDGVRPETVTITLYGYQWNAETNVWETVVKGTATIKGDVTEDTWTYTFDKLPIYHDGEEIIYSAEITSDLNANLPYYSNGYTQVTNEMTIAVSHDVNLGSITTSVQWIDDNDNDDVRPEQIQVQLYADETALGEPVTLSEANNWSYRWDNLLINVEGKEGERVIYSVKVLDDLSDDYAIVYTPESTRVTDEQNLLITITHDADLLDRTVTIYWNDESNRDGNRPGKVTITLYGYQWNAETNVWETVTKGFATINGDVTEDTWTYTFEQLPIFHDGKQIIYSAAITSDMNANLPEYANGFTQVTNGMDITVSHDRDLGNISTSVQWDDVDDNDGVRPEQISVTLYANDTAISTVMLNEANDWSYVWTNLDVNTDGREGERIIYRVEVNDDLSENYEIAYDPSTTVTTDEQNILITISHEVIVGDKTITIIWDDESNRDGVRPSDVTVTLYAYQWNAATARWEYRIVATQTMTGDTDVDTWYITFEDVPLTHNGVEIIYYAQITSDLNAQVTGNQYSTESNELTIVASRKLETKSVTATIEWDDNANNDQIRPDSVVIQLYKIVDGKAVAVEGEDYRVIVAGDPTAATWSYTFEGLPIYEEGRTGIETIYAIEVLEVEDGSIYGTYISTANGAEEEIVRYEASYITTSASVTSKLDESGKAYAKLSHTDETRTIYLYATWHDSNNVDGVRPETILVTLYKTVDGITFSDIGQYFLSSSNYWSYKLAGLPVNENGKEITYTIALTGDAPDGYDTVQVEGVNVHLYHTAETGSVTAAINWSDNNNNDGSRPDAVIVTLYANGVATDVQLEANATNNWTVTWNDLLANGIVNGKAGVPVEYSVVVEMPDGYTATYVPGSTTTTNPQVIYVTLAHEADTIDLDATVVWQDNNNVDGVRPNSVNVQLYANGTKVAGKTLTITGDGDTWTGAFEDLPKYENGVEIYYSIEANDSVVSTYAALPAGMTLYLSRDITTANLKVNVKFDDANDADGLRPDTYYIYLTVNGYRVFDSDYIIIADGEDGAYEFFNLPVYENGVSGDKLVYGVEVEFDDYYGSTDYTVKATQNNAVQLGVNKTSTITLTLTRDVETATLTGYIYWFDNNNNRGNRPESIVVNVHNDANNIIRVYTVNSATGEVTDVNGNIVGDVNVSEWGSDGSSCWTYTIEGLPENAVYDNGASSRIFYYTTAQTVGIAVYYTNITDGYVNGMRIALTHMNYLDDAASAQQDYTVKILWQDNSNAWTYRPDTLGVVVHLYANGVEYKSVTLTSAEVDKTNGNLWTYVFKDLPTYLNGTAVIWTATIDGVDTYTESYTYTAEEAVITMTQSVGFNFTVRWEDDGDNDGARPDGLRLNVYADGSLVGNVTLTASDENTYTGSIFDLPVWRTVGNNPYDYTFTWSEATATELKNSDYTATATRDGEKVESRYFYWISATEWGVNLVDYGYDDISGTYSWETTLTRNIELTTEYGQIIFDDDGNRDGIRPDVIYVQLFADGEPVGDPTEVTGDSASSMWTVQFDEMPVYEGGVQIVYTIEIVTVPDGYNVSYDGTGLVATLKHASETSDVIATIIWDDSSEIHYEYNSLGTLISTYYGIERADIYVQLYANGIAYGEPLLISEQGYYLDDETIAASASVKWADMFVNESGSEIVYTIKVYSNALNELYEEGYTTEYDFTDNYAPAAVIAHTYYDVEGNVYFLYNDSEDFLLEGVQVVAYLYDAETDTYTSVGSDITDENGHYVIRNIPQGLLVIRATYIYSNYNYAGSIGVKLDRHDAVADVIINRDATIDSDLYTYSVTGNAYYQLDKTDPDTIFAVPENSIVLLYKVVDGSDSAEYVTMTKTDADGGYAFTGLADGQYIVNVIFNYDGGTYTYDNGDAEADGISFLISGVDVKWPDIIKQVNAVVEPGDVTDVEDDPSNPVITEPAPCVTFGFVYFSDNGVHTTEPISDVDVYVYNADNNALIYTVTTDENGKWLVEGLPTGNYIAVFSYAGNASRVLEFAITDDDFNNGSYEAAPQYFDRSANKSTATIMGVVLDEDGNYLSTLVKIYDESGNLVDFAYTDTNGRYEFTVISGFTYRVVIDEVKKEVLTYAEGDLGDDLTSLSYYLISGNFTIDGEAQINSIVALYSLDSEGQPENVLTATLTDENGNYSLRAEEAGNYAVIPYKDGDRYELIHVTVGADNSTELDIDCYVTISGKLLDSDGNVLVGSTVRLLDADGNQVGNSQTIYANGTFGWTNVLAGEYTVEITYPVMGDRLADRTTEETDSFGRAYVGGMTANSVWVWNINASTVSGSVTDQNGNPIANAIVILQLIGDTDKAYATLTDANGNWFAGVMPGEYIVSASFSYNTEYVYVSENTVNVTVTDEDIDGVNLIINRNTLDGTVVRDGDGQPVKGAEVVVTLPDGTVVETVTTDENGSFTVVLYGDTYNITVNYGDVSANVQVIMDSDKEITIELALLSYITGTVTHEDGTAVTDAIVYYDGPVSGFVYTDAEGKYVIAITTEQYGDYTIYATANGVSSESKTVNVKTDTVVDLVLPDASEGTHMIHGVVTDNEGNRLENAVVTIVYGDDKTNVITTSTDANGYYEVYVVDGTYYITVSYEADNGNIYETNGETAVIVLGDDVEKNIAIKMTFDVTVTVIDSDGNVIKGAVITYSGADSGSVTTDESGKVSISVKGGTYTFTAAIGNRTSNAMEVEITQNTAITIVVPTAGLAYEPPTVDSTDLTITGTVLDPGGNPVEGVTVILLRFDDVTETWVECDVTISGEDGSYIFTGVEEGVYQVYYEITLNIDNVTSEPGNFTISGVALDPDGNPYEYATVILINSNGAEEHRVTADENGYYEFTDLEPGDYTIIIYIDDSDEPVDEFDATAEPTEEVISGTVVDEDGNPVSGATVIITNNTNTWTVVTDESGDYSIVVPAGDNYTVTITYPITVIINTGDADDEHVTESNFTISGYVHDTDGNPVEGAHVIIKDLDGNIVAETDSDENGYYEVTNLEPGTYIVIIISTTPDDTKEYEVDTGNGNDDDEHGDDDEPNPPVVSFVISGTVVTNHHRRLPYATVEVINLNTNEVISLTADENGNFTTGEIPAGRYELYAIHTDANHGDMESDPVIVERSRDDVELVIILKYTADIDGDGEPEDIYAGEDDTFGTEDDYYLTDPDDDGEDDEIYAGEDGKPGTEDDFYEKDVDDDGEDEKIYVGDDTEPGTEDDFYEKDIDGDGEDEKIYAGEDGEPGTEDDFYEDDVDGDGEDEKIYVGGDTEPGTEDDYYEDEDGNKHLVTVMVIFDANGGTVEGKNTLEVDVSTVTSLPTAVRSGYTFNGWYTDPDSGTKVTLSTVQALTEPTTYYAHWTKNSSSGSGGDTGGGDGGDNGGGTGGSTPTPAPVEPITQETVIEILEDTPYLTGEHVLYLIGYDDGLVHPEGNLTRAQMAAIIYRLLTDEARATFGTSNCTFSDVSPDAWYATEVATLANMGIILGYDNGNFGPDDPITRAQMVTMMIRFLVSTPTYTGSDAFSDISDSWAREAINIAASLGWVAGNGDGTFRPDSYITRAEAVTIINRVLNRDKLDLDVLLDGMITFPDNMNKSAWYYLAMQEAVNGHSYTRDDNGGETWVELDPVRHW